MSKCRSGRLLFQDTISPYQEKNCTDRKYSVSMISQTASVFPWKMACVLKKNLERKKIYFVQMSLLWPKDNYPNICLHQSNSKRRKHRFTAISAFTSEMPSCFTFYDPGMERKLPCRQCPHRVIQKLQLSGKVWRIGTSQLEGTVPCECPTFTNNGSLPLSHLSSNVTSSLDLPLVFQLQAQPPLTQNHPHCPIFSPFNILCVLLPNCP